MIQSNFFLSLLKSFALLLTITVFVSCSTEEDPRPQDEEVMFQVDLLKIAAINIKEAEGDALEIYGDIGSQLVKGNVTETNPLWSEVKEGAISVGYNDVPLVSSVTYTLLSSEVDQSEMIINAYLWDSDGTGTNAPEVVGNESISTPLANIRTSAEYQIVLNDDVGQSIRLTYSITRL